MPKEFFARIEMAQEGVHTSPTYFHDNSRRSDPSFITIQRTLEGKAFFRDSAGYQLVPPGFAIVFTNDEATSYGYPKDAVEPYRHRYLTLRSMEIVRPLFNHLRRVFGSMLHLPDGSESALLFNEIFTRYRNGTFRDHFHESELIYGLLTALYREQERETHVRDPIEFGHDYIRSHFHLPVNLKTIAERSSVSREHLIRRFRQRYGESPGAMLRRLRLEHAHAILSSTALNTEEVALACGFSNSNSFGSAYRSKYGYGPRKRA